MICYKEFRERTYFTQEELIAFAYGRLVSDPPAEFSRLPAPPFLMMTRVLEIEKDGSRGRMVAEKDIRMDEWFFQCHFNGDPVQPGCLGVDAVWQLLGFYGVLCGSEGNGRALGCKEVNFDGQIRPFNKVVRYDIEVKRFSALAGGAASFIVGTGIVSVDGEEIYQIRDAKVGIFKGIAYPDYPERSVHSVGGVLRQGS